MIAAVVVGVLVAGAVMTAGATRALLRRRRDARFGALVQVEPDAPRTFRSERYGLAGRPDELREGRGGRLIPVEWKHRAAPWRGAFFSHTVQVWAYCLLIEEETGHAPPFGVLRYTDAQETVPWNPAARSALLAIRREALAPYDGRADPSPAKCARCAWSERCDASAVRAPPPPA